MSIRVKRAHLDSEGRRWHIGDDATGHPDLAAFPYLFEREGETPAKPKRTRAAKPKGE